MSAIADMIASWGLQGAVRTTLGGALPDRVIT
jgi:hypothetical protein